MDSNPKPNTAPREIHVQQIDAIAAAESLRERGFFVLANEKLEVAAYLLGLVPEGHPDDPDFWERNHPIVTNTWSNVV